MAKSINIEQSIRDYFRAMGVKGSKERMKKTTTEQRREIARKAGSAPKSPRKPRKRKP